MVLQDCWYRALERIMYPSKPAVDIVKRYEVRESPICIKRNHLSLQTMSNDASAGYRQ
jgi:hypothetical protein